MNIKERIEGDCSYFHKDYCIPCLSPENHKECDLVKIGERRKAALFIKKYTLL